MESKQITIAKSQSNSTPDFFNESYDDYLKFIEKEKNNETT